MTVNKNILPRSASEVSSPEEMVEVLLASNYSDPQAEAIRRRKMAVNANNQEDVNFWDKVGDLLMGDSDLSQAKTCH